MTEAEGAGGVEWELQKAFELIAAARLAGDFVAESLGWTRFSEGLRNGAAAASAAQLIPLLLRLQKVTDAREEDAIENEHKVGLLIDIMEDGQAEQGKQAALSGLDHMAILAFTAQMAINTAQIAELRARIKALEKKV